MSDTTDRFRGELRHRVGPGEVWGTTVGPGEEGPVHVRVDRVEGEILELSRDANGWHVHELAPGDDLRIPEEDGALIEAGAPVRFRLDEQGRYVGDLDYGDELKRGYLIPEPFPTAEAALAHARELVEAISEQLVDRVEAGLPSPSAVEERSGWYPFLVASERDEELESWGLRWRGAPEALARWR